MTTLAKAENDLPPITNALESPETCNLCSHYVHKDGHHFHCEKRQQCLQLMLPPDHTRCGLWKKTDNPVCSICGKPGKALCDDHASKYQECLDDGKSPASAIDFVMAGHMVNKMIEEAIEGNLQEPEPVKPPPKPPVTTTTSTKTCRRCTYFYEIKDSPCDLDERTIKEDNHWHCTGPGKRKWGYRCIKFNAPPDQATCKLWEKK